jgi:hypothetical protein
VSSTNLLKSSWVIESYNNTFCFSLLNCLGFISSDTWALPTAPTIIFNSVVSGRSYGLQSSVTATNYALPEDIAMILWNESGLRSIAPVSNITMRVNISWRLKCGSQKCLSRSWSFREDLISGSILLSGSILRPQDVVTEFFKWAVALGRSYNSCLRRHEKRFIIEAGKVGKECELKVVSPRFNIITEQG